MSILLSGGYEPHPILAITFVILTVCFLVWTQIRAHAPKQVGNVVKKWTRERHEGDQQWEVKQTQYNIDLLQYEYDSAYDANHGGSSHPVIKTFEVDKEIYDKVELYSFIDSKNNIEKPKLVTDVIEGSVINYWEDYMGTLHKIESD